MSTVYTGFPARTPGARARALGPPLAVVAAAGACCGIVLWGDPTTPGGPLPVCPTKALLGIDCPGCGSMRMLYSLLHGDLPAALHYNAVSLVALVLCGWSLAVWALGRWRGRHVRSWLHWRGTPLAFGVVFVTWFVIRNLPGMPFAFLHV
jgi:Protein of unknown function (DUF2752)